MNLAIRAEDIMTPRRQLHLARTEEAADRIASKHNFDAVPLISRNGVVATFWSRIENRRVRITKKHSTPHDTPVELLLPVLGAHVVQFVLYRGEMVGLVDASDLNKPISCLAWLQPMLELERSILSVVSERQIDEEAQSQALGADARGAQQRQAKAKKHDLALPLLEYAQFPSLLRASSKLGITHLSNAEVDQLNDIRRRAAHGAGDPVIENRKDCFQLKETLTLARTVATRLTKQRRP